MRVGPEIGVTIGALIGPAGSAAAAEPIAIGMVAYIGDSNAVGQGSTDQADKGFAVTTAHASLLHNATYALGTADPPTMVDVATEALQPYDTGAGPGFGYELEAGREWAREGYDPYTVKFAINGTTAADYAPASTYPSTGGNLLARLKTYLDAQVVASGDTLTAVVISLGTNDSGTAPLAAAYGANLAAITASLRTTYGAGLIVVLPKVNAGCSGANLATVRAAQDAYAAGDPLCVLVENDDITLVDGLHYAADGYLTMGQRVAFALLDELGHTRRSATAAAPEIVGRGVATRGGGDLTPIPYAGVKAGDREFLFTATGLVNGAPAPSLSVSAGFTAVTDSLSEFVTSLDQHAAVWTRLVDQATLDANGGRMPAPTVLDGNSFNAAIIFAVRGPNADPAVGNTAVSKNDDYGTAHTVTGINTVAANELVLYLLAAYSGAGTTTVSVTGSDEYHDGIYAIGADYEMLFIASNAEPVAGPSGSMSATTTSTVISAGICIGVRP